jgi:uncharacterized protein (TIGR00369 family)
MEQNISSEIIKLEPRADNVCFGCGGGNAQGMKLVFEADPATRRVTGKFRLGPEYQGSLGMLHGGITAVLFDEAMGKLCRFSDSRAVTAELSVEYLKPIRVNQEIIVEAFETERKGRQLFHQAEIRSTDGALLARGKARFVIIDPAKYAEANSLQK